LAAFNAIADRCDGKPKTIIGGDDETPIQVMVSRGQEARLRIEKQLQRIGERAVEVGEGLCPASLAKWKNVGDTPSRGA